MIVVSDTSPINYLILIDEIELLRKLFGQVIIPPAVVSELQNTGTPQIVREWIASPPSWLCIQKPTGVNHRITLGSGELETISLAEEIKADLILVDDRKARKIADERNIKTAGTLNIIKSASKRNLIDLQKAFQKLERTNFRVSPNLLSIFKKGG